MIKMDFIGEIKGMWREASYAFEMIRKNKLTIFYNVIFDMLTLLFIGYISALFSKKAMEYLYSAGALLTKASSSATFLSGGLSDFAKQAGAMPILFKFMLVLSIWLLFSYFIYSFFQSLCWFNARKLLGEKNVLYKFSLRFFKINIFWAVIYAVFNIIVYASLFLTSIRNNTETQIGPFPGIVLFIIGYFAFVSYSIFKKEKLFSLLKLVFKKGIKYLPYIIFRLLLIGVVFFGIDLILRLSSKIHPFIMILVGILLFIPAVTWSRIYFAYCLKLIHNKK